MLNSGDLAQRRARLTPEQRNRLVHRLAAARVPALHESTIPRRKSLEPVLLSYAQQRHWFLWQLEPLSTAYHLSGALHLSGQLDVGALRSSFDALVMRHESLRTVFRANEEGLPDQIIEAERKLDIPVIDLCGLPAEQRAACAHEEAGRVNAIPFDLTQGPLLRVVLIRKTPEEHLLVVVMHHIVSDAWSNRIVIDEFAAQYRARTQGQEPSLPALPIQYADYAVWQRNWLEAGEKDRQLAYWRGQLGEDHPVLQLPTDHPRPSIASYRAARHSFVLPASLVAGLQRQAQSRGATLFMALLAGFQALLQRYTGQNDVRVGVPIANRHRIEVESIVGFFVNTQVLRNRIDGRMPLKVILDQSREAALGAQAHQDLPFEQLVEALQPERSLNQNPLFQVMYNHLREDHRALEQLPALTVENHELGEQAAQFELTLDTVEQPDGQLGVTFTYAAELFEPDTIRRLGEHYVHLLQQLAEHPESSLGDIDLLSEAERAQLKAWGINEQRYANAEPVHCLIERQVEAHPEAVALIFGGTELSYSELNRRANRLAHRLIALGVKPETKVGIAVERSIEMIVGLLAILKAGGAYVPLDPEYPQERLNYMVEDSGVRLLLTQNHTKARIPHSSKLDVLEFDTLDLSAGIETNPEVTLHGDNLAYVIYTSGSTGRPKGVMVTHGPLAMHLTAIREIYDVRPGDRELMFFSMNFDAAAEQWMTPLCEGATIVLSSARELASDSFTNLIAAHRITTLHLPPAYLRLILPLKRDGGSSVRTCIAGGEAWFAADLAATQGAFQNVRLVNAYGPTETIITPTAWVGSTALGIDGDYAPIGRPVGERNVYVFDTELNLVPVGTAGELYIGGSGLARGYLSRPALTGERFVADPFSQTGGRLYRTGDLVRWRMDGQLEYVGRLDHQIKIRGFRAELGEIEAQLLAQTGVRDSAVVAQESRNGTRLIAYVAAHSGVLLNSAMLKTALGAVLPDYMLPGSFVFLDALPLSPNGKVDRKALPLPEQLNEQDYDPPVSRIETMISEIWAEILDMPRVGLNNNFFDLGGHSLLLIKVQCKLEERLNTRIAIIDLFKYTTVASLAKFLGQERTEHLSLQRHQERAQRQRGTFIQRKRKVGREN